MIPGTSSRLEAVKTCLEGYFQAAAEIDMSNTVEARWTAQRYMPFREMRYSSITGTSSPKQENITKH